MRRLWRERGLPAEKELRARIGVRAEQQSATIIPMNTVSHIATEFATVSMRRESAQPLAMRHCVQPSLGRVRNKAVGGRIAQHFHIVTNRMLPVTNSI